MSKPPSESPPVQAQEFVAGADAAHEGRSNVADRLVDELIAAKRAADLGTMNRVTERLLRGAGLDAASDGGQAADEAGTVGGAAPLRASTASLSPLAQHDRGAKIAYDKAVVECREALSKSFANATAPERVLIDLVARELPIAFSVVAAQQKLAARLTADPILANAAWVRTLAQALRDVTGVNHAITRRIEGLLGAASNLRAQRHLLEIRDGAK